MTLRPMTQREYETFVDRLAASYAADHVVAGSWTAAEAPGRAAAELKTLLPDGLGTSGHLLRTAESPDGAPVGLVWVGPRHNGRAGAWIYDIEVAAAHRGRGYGAAVLAAAEDEVRAAGVPTLGLNVFAPNAPARRMYERAGYQVTSQQLRKAL